MKPAGILLAVVLLGSVGVTGSHGGVPDRRRHDSKKPSLRAPSFAVRGITVRRFAICAACEMPHSPFAPTADMRTANAYWAISGNSSQARPWFSLLDNDEDEADKQIAAREPMIQRGGEKKAVAMRREPSPLFRSMNWPPASGRTR